MRFGPARYFRKPRARHEDARGGDPVLFERLLNSAVHGVRHAEVVGVNHEQARIGRIAEALRDGFGWGHTLSAHSHRKDQRRKQTNRNSFVHASKTPSASVTSA